MLESVELKKLVKKKKKKKKKKKISIYTWQIN